MVAFSWMSNNQNTEWMWNRRMPFHRTAFCRRISFCRLSNHRLSFHLKLSFFTFLNYLFAESHFVNVKSLIVISLNCIALNVKSQIVIQLKSISPNISLLKVISQNLKLPIFILMNGIPSNVKLQLSFHLQLADFCSKNCSHLYLQNRLEFCNAVFTYR